MCRRLSYFLIIFSFFVYNLSFSFELPKEAETHEAETHIEEIKKSAEAWKKGEQETIAQEELMQKKQRLEELKKTIEKQPMWDKTTTKDMYENLIALRSKQLEHDLLSREEESQGKETALEDIEVQIKEKKAEFKRLEKLKQEALQKIELEIEVESKTQERLESEGQSAFGQQAPEVQETLKLFEGSIEDLKKRLPDIIAGTDLELTAEIEGLLKTIDNLPETLQKPLFQRVKDTFDFMKDTYIESSGKEDWQVLTGFKALEKQIARKLTSPDQISNKHLGIIQESTTQQNSILLFTQLMIWKESLEGYGYDEQTKQSVINEFEKLKNQIEQAQKKVSDAIVQEQLKELLSDVETRMEQLKKYDVEFLQNFLQKLSEQNQIALQVNFSDFEAKIPLDQLATLIEYVNFQQGVIKSLQQQAEELDGSSKDMIDAQISRKKKSLAQDVRFFDEVIEALDLEETTKEEAIEYFERTAPKMVKSWLFGDYIQEPGDVTVEQLSSDVFKRAVKQAIWDGVSWGAPRALEIGKQGFKAVSIVTSLFVMPVAGFVWDNLAEPLVLKKLSSYYYSLPIEHRIEVRSIILKYNDFLQKTSDQQQQIISNLIDVMKNVKEATQQTLEQAQDVVVNLNEQIKSLRILTQLFQETKVYRLFRISNEKISKVIDSFNKINKAVEDKVNLQGLSNTLQGIDMEQISEVIKSISGNVLSASETIQPSLEKFAVILTKDAEAAAQQGKIIYLFKTIEQKLPKEKPKKSKMQLAQEKDQQAKKPLLSEQAEEQLSLEEPEAQLVKVGTEEQLPPEKVEKSEEQRPQVEGAWQRVKTVFGKLRDNLVDSFRRLRRRFVSAEKDYNQTVKQLQAELKKAKGETIEEKFTFIAKSPDGKARLQVLVDRLTRYTREMLTVKQEAEKNAEEFSIAITSFPKFIEAITVQNIENLPQDLTKAVDSFDAITQWRTKAGQEVKQELTNALNEIDVLKQDVNDPVWEFLSGDVFKEVTSQAVSVLEKSQLLFAGQLDEAFVSRLKQVQKEVIAQEISALKQLSKFESKDQAASFLNEDNSIQLLSNIEVILFKIKNDLQANDEPSQQEAKVYLKGMQEALGLESVEQMQTYFRDLKILFDQVNKDATNEGNLTLQKVAKQAQETIDPVRANIENPRGIANILSTIDTYSGI